MLKIYVSLKAKIYWYNLIVGAMVYKFNEIKLNKSYICFEPKSEMLLAVIGGLGSLKLAVF